MQGKPTSNERITDNAIHYAYKAYSLLGSGNIMRKVYSLNQYLYYLLENGPDSLRTEMSTTASLLARYKGERTLWGYRYDETLSRYFYRLALLEDNEVSWTELMHCAIRHVEEAARESHGDKAITA